MRSNWNSFWRWYNQHLLLNTAIAAFLFALQIIHLYWLTTDVVTVKLFGVSYFHPSGFFKNLLLLVDYTEVPALITTSLVYINELRKGFNWKAVLFLIFLNSQFLHIFWITDEFVVGQFTGTAELVNIPGWLAWIAIFIDYLELPVIFETFKKLFNSVSKKDLKKIKQALSED